MASSIGTTTGAPSSSSVAIGLGEEADHGLGERVVLVARHHVAGSGDVDVAGVWHECEEGTDSVLVDDVTQTTPHQESRYAERARGGFEPLEILRRARGPVAAHEARIPVPPVAAVGPQAKVLAQPVEIARTRAMRDVRGDRIRGVVERREAVGVAAHELDDAADT